MAHRHPSLLDPSFRYVPAATHAASSAPFLQRQRKRLAEAQASAAETRKKVTPLVAKKARA